MSTVVSVANRPTFTASLAAQMIAMITQTRGLTLSSKSLILRVKGCTGQPLTQGER